MYMYTLYKLNFVSNFRLVDILKQNQLLLLNVIYLENQNRL